MHCDDVRMCERGDGKCFLFEAPDPFRVAGELGGQDLDGHVPAQPRVVGAVHGSHASGPEQPDHVEGTEAGAGGERHGWWQAALNSKGILKEPSGLRVMRPPIVAAQGDLT
jgi:hypothetical protein